MNKSEWVAVGDMLPEELINVLAFDGKDVMLCYYCELEPPGWDFSADIEDYDGEFDLEKITHWMPIPKTPEAK